MNKFIGIALLFLPLMSAAQVPEYSNICDYNGQEAIAKFKDVHCDGRYFGAETGYEQYLNQASAERRKIIADWICYKYGFARSKEHFTQDNLKYSEMRFYTYTLHGTLLFNDGYGSWQEFPTYYTQDIKTNTGYVLGKYEWYGKYYKDITCER